MSQNARTLTFTFDKLINIVFKPILLSESKLLLLYRKIAKNTASFPFYIDNIFGAFKIY